MRLLEILHNVVRSFDATKNETISIMESDMKFMIGFQGKTASIDELATFFRSRVDTIKAHEGRPRQHPAQAKRIFDRQKEKEGWSDTAYNAFFPNVKKALNNKAVSLTRQKYLTCLFIGKADAGRYGKLKNNHQ